MAHASAAEIGYVGFGVRRSSHNSSLPPEGMAAFLTSGAPAAVFLEGLVVSGVKTTFAVFGMFAILTRYSILQEVPMPSESHSQI